MLDQLIGGLKGELISGIQEKTGLDSSKAEATIPLAKNSIQEGLLGAVSNGNLSGIMGMFSGGGNMMENMVYKSIAGSFVSKMVGKLGLPESIAGQVSSFALPMIMKVVGNKASDEQGNIEKEGLLKMIGGGNEGIKDMASDMLKNKVKGGLGKLFGK